MFNASTHTEAIAIGADDLLCYAADKAQLLKAMKLAFDSSLILVVQPFLRAAKVVKAFHSVIEKIRGQRQSDREYARKQYASYVKFDPTLEIGVSIAVLTNLQIAIEFATNIPLSEEEKKAKLSELVFCDKRIVMQTSLIDSISKSFSYQQMCDQLVYVMGLLPYEMQTSSTEKINVFEKNVKSDQKTLRYCWKFQRNECKDKNCRFIHQLNPQNKGKSDTKPEQQVSKQKDKVDSVIKPFKVYLSETDRKYVGKPDSRTDRDHWGS